MYPRTCPRLKHGRQKHPWLHVFCCRTPSSQKEGDLGSDTNTEQLSKHQNRGLTSLCVGFSHANIQAQQPQASIPARPICIPPECTSSSCKDETMLRMSSLIKAHSQEASVLYFNSFTLHLLLYQKSASDLGPFSCAFHLAIIAVSPII